MIGKESSVYRSQSDVNPNWIYDERIDISNEFMILNSFSTMYSGQDTFKAFLYPNYSRVYIPSSVRFFRLSPLTNDSLTGGWIRIAQYTGSRFYTTKNSPSQDEAPLIYNFNGMPMFSGLRTDGNSNSWLCRVQYIGNSGQSESYCAIAYKNLTNLDNNGVDNAGVVGPITFEVTPR